MKNVAFGFLLCCAVSTSVGQAKALDALDLSTVEVTGTISKSAPADDDEDTFFSRGSAASVKTFKSPRASIAALDVVAVCRAVLADNPAYYERSFYERCRTTVMDVPTRRAARRIPHAG